VEEPVLISSILFVLVWDTLIARESKFKLARLILNLCLWDENIMS